MIIGFDFDNTLFPTMQEVIKIYNKRHKDDLTYEQVTAYNLHECFPSSVASKLIDIFCDKELYDNLKPYKNAVSTLKRLVQQKHDVYILTATDAKNLVWKEELLEKYFPFLSKDRVVRIHDKSRFNLDVMVDDCIDVLKSCLCERIVVDAPYNQNDIADFAYGIKRITDLQEVIGVVEKYKKEIEGVVI